jgi:hypothetical protein
MTRLSCLLIVLLAAATLGTGVARATPADVAFDGTTASLTEADPGGWTAKVGVTNLTGAPIDGVTVVAPGCSATAAPDKLPAAQHTDVTVTLPADCKAADPKGGYSFTVTTGGQSAKVTAKEKDASDVDWAPFTAFLVALIAGVVLMIGVAVVYAASKKHSRPKLLDTINGLDKSWTLKDSWASNLTAASGLIVAFLGTSDPLKAVLGDNADATVGAATVAGAIALALTGAAGVIVLTVQKPGGSDVTVLGLLGGCAVAFGAAGGQIWTLTLVLGEVDLGVGDEILWVAAIAASLLLAFYAVMSVYDLLVTGLDTAKAPLTKTVDPEVYAAAIEVAAARGGTLNHDVVEGVLQQLKVQDDDEPSEKRSLRHRSALL